MLCYAMLCLGYDAGLSRQAFIVIVWDFTTHAFDGMIVIPQYKGIVNAMLSLRVILRNPLLSFRSICCSVSSV